MDFLLLARFPFLPEAKEYLSGISLEELLTSDDYSLARELGFKRISHAIEGKRLDLSRYLGRRSTQRDVFLSFIVAKLILIAMKDNLVARRFANAERDRLVEILESVPDSVDLVARTFGIRFSRADMERLSEKYGIWKDKLDQGANYEIYFLDFIRYAKNFSDDRFRLNRQYLKGGWLPLRRHDFILLLREAFVEHFMEEIEAQRDKAGILEKFFKEEIEKLRDLRDDYLSTYRSVDYGEVVSDAFPPCIKTIIAKIQSGVNVSHEARFSLVAFLHQVGMSNDEILKIFATVPDFRKDLTMYQINHITGKISGKEYKVPKCATMRSYGLCVRDVANDKLCMQNWMTHPLLYYKIKKDKIRKGASRQSKSAESQ